jgi:cell division septal protein FtsQ
MQTPSTETPGRPRRGTSNRRLPQRRPLRARLRSARAAVGVGLGQAGRGLARVLPFLVLAALVAGVGTGVMAAWRWLKTTPAFALERVTVEGHGHVTPEAVIVASGVVIGQDNLFALSTDTLAERIERLPWVADAEVVRDLPHGLRVRVTEREARGLLVLDAAYLLDADGRPFKRAALETGEAVGLPVVTGLDRAAWQRDADQAAAASRLAIELTSRWNRDRERPAVGEANLSPLGVTLYTAEHAVALRLGRITPAALEGRLARFDAAWSGLSDDERDKAQIVYLDSDTRHDRVTVKLADAR